MTNDKQIIIAAYQSLVSNLEELAKLYRPLLEVIRKEKNLLINAEIQALDESNKSKEAFLFKIRSLESQREKLAAELGQAMGMTSDHPRLLELAAKIQGPESEKLKAIHSTLELLLSQVSEANKENGIYAESALKTLGGALGEIKDTVSGKKTYERKGKMTQGPDKAGNFVSKEA